jgi:predicted Zn finger-like uncharacterized protein
MANPDFNRDRQRSASASGLPQSCPSCASASIVSTAKVPDATNSYWRCSRCGEVWNPARRMTRMTHGGRAW